jgi:hypothetical protein
MAEAPYRFAHHPGLAGELTGPDLAKPGQIWPVSFFSPVLFLFVI